MLAGRVIFDTQGIASSHLIVSNSHKRFSLVFFPPKTGVATLSNDKGNALGQGLNLLPGQSPVYLTLKDHGDLVQKEWYVVYDVGATLIGWSEGMA